MGEVQLLKAALSRLHSKLEPVSVEENARLAEALFTVPDGPESMVVSGAVVSTVTLVAVEAEEVFPAGSVAVAVIEWLPSLSALLGVKLQLPVLSAVVVPSLVMPS